MRQQGRLRRRWLLVAAFVVTVAPLAVVLSYLDELELTKAVRDLQLLFLLPGLAFMFAHIVLGGLRMQLFTNGVNDSPTLVAVHAVGTFARGAVPAGLGEVAYISLMRRFCVPEWGNAAAGTVASRSLDVVTGFLALCVLTPTLSSSNPKLLDGVWIGLGVVSAGIVIFISWAILAAQKTRSESQRWSVRLLRDFLSGLAVLRKGGVIVRALLLTLSMQAALFGVYCCMCKTLSSSISFPTIAGIYLFLWPMSLLPVRGFLDLGTHEGSWTVVLMALGYDAATSSFFAVGSHAMLFAAKSIVAVAATIFLFRSAGRRVKRSTVASGGTLAALESNRTDDDQQQRGHAA